jgi:hypothetical protein
VVAIAAAQSAERVINGFVYTVPMAVMADAQRSLHCARTRLAEVSKTNNSTEVLMMDEKIQCMKVLRGKIDKVGEHMERLIPIPSENKHQENTRNVALQRHEIQNFKFENFLLTVICPWHI